MKHLIYTLVCLCAISVMAHNDDSPLEELLHYSDHHRIEKIDHQAMLDEDEANAEFKVGGVRFAQKFKVEHHADNVGKLHIHEDGSTLGVHCIKADSAHSIGLLFSPFYLDERDTLFIFTYEQGREDGICLTEKNNIDSEILPIAPIVCDSLILELHQYHKESSQSRVKLTDINYGYTDFRKQPRNNGATQDHCSIMASCDEASAQLKQSAVLLIIDGAYLCSGTLVNNTAQDGKPLVLTAAHCFGTGVSEAEKIALAPTVITYFDYEAPNCNSTIQGSFEFEIGGSTMRALSSDIDLALIELSKEPPADFRPYYAGWNRAKDPTPPSPYRGVHHPNGTITRVALANQITPISATSFGGLTMIDDCFWRVRWSEGTTASGSSGSGLFDANGKVIGALTGGSSSCESSGSDYYSRIEKSWNHYTDISKQLKAWLDPTNSGVTTLDGYDPYDNTVSRLTNLTKGEEVEKHYLPQGGLIAGENAMKSKEYAEYYSMDENSTIYGVYLVNSIASTAYNKVSVSVYSKGADGKPDRMLGSQPIRLRTMYYTDAQGFYETNKGVLAGNENYMRFDTPISAGKDFFVAYTVSYFNMPTDSFAVFTAKERTGSLPETSFVRQSNDSWMSIDEFAGFDTALWMDPVVRVGNAQAGTEEPFAVPTTFAVATLHPNPVKESLHINFSETPKKGTTATIFNSTGQKLAVNPLIDKHNQIAVHNLYAGIYFVQINSAEGKETHKIIIE